MKLQKISGAICALGVSALLAPHAKAQDISYQIPSGVGGADIFQNQVTINSTVNTTYEGMLGNSWGYAGLQQVNSTTEHVGLFSMWDQNNDPTKLVAYSPYLSIRDIGRYGDDPGTNVEGTGAHCNFNYGWQLNKPYRLAYRLWSGPDATHGRLSGFIYDGSNWQYITTFSLNTGGGLLSGPYAFNEKWVGTNIGTRSQIFNNCWWHTQGTSPAWANLRTVTVSNTPGTTQQGSGAPPNDYGKTTAINGSGIQIYSSTTPPGSFPSGSISYTAGSSEKVVYMPYFINCGADVADGSSVFKVFEPDAFYSGSSSVDATGSGTVDISNDQGAVTSTVMKSTRYGANFSYKLVGFKPNSSVNAYIHFAETYYGSAGQRFQDVICNGVTKLTNYDIFTAAGGKNKAVCPLISFTTDSQGTATIQFQHSPGKTGDPYASVNAIEVYPNVTTGTASVQATPSNGAS